MLEHFLGAVLLAFYPISGECQYFPDKKGNISPDMENISPDMENISPDMENISPDMSLENIAAVGLKKALKLK